jgi:hypothetical protein
MINEIGCYLGGGAEEWSIFDIIHVGRERWKLMRGSGRVPRMQRDYKGKLWKAGQPQPDMHGCVQEVNLCHVHRPMARVGIHDGMEQVM